MIDHNGGAYYGELWEGIPHGFGILIKSPKNVGIGYFNKGKRHGYFTNFGMMDDEHNRILKGTLPYVAFVRFY